MKGGPTDPPNCAEANSGMREEWASMKGGPTDPPNHDHCKEYAQQQAGFNEGGAY